MGQYHVIANLTKHEFVRPHAFRDGAKVHEFAVSSEGTMTALAMLLYGSDFDGGGFFRIRKPTETPVPEGWARVDHGKYVLEHPMIAGRWAGDVVVIIGDYVQKDRWWKEAGLDRKACSAEWSKKRLAKLKEDVKIPENRSGGRMQNVGTATKPKWVITDKWIATETAKQAFDRRRHYYTPDKCGLYQYAQAYWKDISDECVDALVELKMMSRAETGHLSPDIALTGGS